MVLKDDLHDRENDKFYEDSNGNTTVRTNDSILDEVKIDSNDGKNIRTSNVNTESTQNEILKQLKIMNIQLGILTGNEIKKTEVE